ncbi:hypothetical protein [Hymenobacter sp.]|jgi:hypothetical protein|uniref:hypothetical protein n=1 Tax=Hymenobacter sp. TaxID=1898978 RepID=UPI002ED862C1
MKKYLLATAIGLSLAACSKADDEDVTPIAITSAFDQNFSLNYRQQASLPSSSQPELTVAVEELDYTFCPKNAYCILADFANPTLGVTDRGGQTQQVKFLMPGRTTNYPDWMDTTSVRANGKRYVFYYIMYNVKAGCDNPGKEDISVKLRITEPTNK